MPGRLTTEPDQPSEQLPLLPSQLAKELILRLKLRRPDWHYAFRLARLDMLLRDFVAAAAAFLGWDDHDTELSLEVLNQTTEALGHGLSDVHWAKYLHEDYGRGTRPKKDSGLEPVLFRGSYWDVWQSRLSGIRALNPELVDQAGTHLSETYVICASIDAVVMAIIVGRAGRYELLHGGQVSLPGLVQAVAQATQYVNGFPDGSAAGLRAELANIRQSLAESEWPDSVAGSPPAKKKASKRRKRASG